MLRDDETIFVLHGLEMDSRVVRANVFVQKLRTLISALNAADKLVNGKRRFDFLLPKLDTGSAIATLRERARTHARSQSSIALFERTAFAVYNGDRSRESLPSSLVKRIAKLSEGVGKQFAHAEIGFPNDNIIRIDEYLLRQAEAAYELVTSPSDKLQESKGYRGIAFGTFDGFLKEIDSRGTMLRGKLVLNPGLEIDCVMNKERVSDARDNFDKRVVIKGAAHYDGKNQLPTRLDVHSIKVVDERPNLLRWKGAFRLPKDDDTGDDL